MGLILFLWDIRPPSGHELHILEIALLAFELKVAIDSDKKGI